MISVILHRSLESLVRFGRVRRIVVGLAGVAGIALVIPVTASAIQGSQFSVPCCATVGGIVAGSDGALWFTEAGRNKIGRVTTDGQITTYPVPSADSGLGTNPPFDIAEGADGRVWFTEPNVDQIAAIATHGSVTEYPVTDSLGSDPDVITAGSDDRLWFAEPGENGWGNSTTVEIGAITTSGAQTYYPIGGVPSDATFTIGSMTAGPDGRVWFTAFVQVGMPPAPPPEYSYDVIGAIASDGTITLYSAPGAVNSAIAEGPDGRLWFGYDSGAAPNTVKGLAAIATNGTITTYPSRPGSPFGVVTAMTAGPDGRLWLSGELSYGAATTGGAVTNYTWPTPPGCKSPDFAGIAIGSDGRIWITDVVSRAWDCGNHEIADEILAITPDGGGSGGGGGISGTTASVGRARSSGETARVKVTCTGAAGTSCKVRLTVSVRETVKRTKVIGATASTRPTKKVIVLAAASVKLTAGHTKTVRIVMNNAGRRLLARLHRLKARLVATAAGATIATQTLTYTTNASRSVKANKRPMAGSWIDIEVAK